ncbi:MAG: methyltransferase domain-containing protein [Chloroflexi bacterium]|uniref:Methyltransferase domain-containing protein n=1 Tax=Candidatus Chlorohelix allophototropha TaxID=3003348 RepID=A0A8T7LVG3_9CHLR|nr:methyltransferase domain-containing protein [Chloroflexota bacterium]WJW66739.1 methyltransferase domain-containing protein [Chloroflexota bacterium L227-S17]
MVAQEMNPEIAHFLVSEKGRAALSSLELEELNENNRLAVLMRLRKSYAPELAGALIEQALLRRKATRAGKFGKAAEMFFTPEGLEQASGETVACYRVERIRQVCSEHAPVADLCCGIGGDALVLAQYFKVTGVDLEETRLTLAEANCAANGVSATFKIANVKSFEVAGFEALFFDPGRRVNGKRLFSVEQYLPPLSTIREWLKKVPEIAVKISPGVDYSELSGYDCEIEIISENSDVKEAVLWFGKFRQTTRRATLLPSRHTLTFQPDKPEIACGEPLAYLYEPDGAVIRAGLVEELALLLGGSTRKIDQDIAYLTSNEAIETPFARRFPVLEYLPWNLKKLNRRLQELDTGKVVVKKRGSPIDPQFLEHALSLKGTRELTIVLTKVMGKPCALICN